jgi:trimethylamine:corrinoid methyltransferase-like protein
LFLKKYERSLQPPWTARAASWNLRAGEVMMTRLADRRPWDTWDREGRVGMAERAREEAEWILADHTVPPLAQDQERELDEIMKEAESELVADQ